MHKYDNSDLHQDLNENRLLSHNTNMLVEKVFGAAAYSVSFSKNRKPILLIKLKFIN